MHRHLKRKNILIICPYPENVAPTQRLKYEQYFGHFRKNGYDLTVSPFMTSAFWKIVYKKGHFAQKVLWVLFGYLRRIFDILRLPFYDGVYVCLWVTPFGGSTFERLVRMFSKKLIYDIDDLVFLGRTSKNNRFIAPLKKPSKYIYLMGCADHVITCTPYLDSFVRKYNPNTTDISSTINTDTYYPSNTYTNDRPLVIGWSGSHSTSPYLHLLDEVLKELSTEFKFKIFVIGDPSFTVPGLNLEAIQWSEPSEVRDLSQIDIGLYPLPDEEWVYGKSGLKALQYMSLGIPTVATAIGANFRVIEDGVSGFLVHTEAEWKDRVKQLIRDPALRRRIGAAARLRVEQHYSIRANQPTYLNIFLSIFGKPERSVAGTNLDPRTVAGFGDEWSRFNQSTLTEAELNEVFSRYFKVFPWNALPKDAIGFDLGCGAGRWSKLVADRVGQLHCIDASDAALEVARQNLAGRSNCSFHVASVDQIPLAEGSMDFGYSLGVLHHVPDTLDGLRACTSKLKLGAPFLLYIYYSFENRPRWYPTLWEVSDRMRRGISKLPYTLRYFVSQILAIFVYFPLARFALLCEKLGARVDNFPLATYRTLSFYMMRVDSLDRFGTRLEQRFTAGEIRRMMEEAGLDNIRFSDTEPYWCAVGYKRSIPISGHTKQQLRA